MSFYFDPRTGKLYPVSSSKEARQARALCEAVCIVANHAAFSLRLDMNTIAQEMGEHLSPDRERIS